MLQTAMYKFCTIFCLFLSGYLGVKLLSFSKYEFMPNFAKAVACFCIFDKMYKFSNCYTTLIKLTLSCFLLAAIRVTTCKAVVH